MALPLLKGFLLLCLLQRWVDSHQNFRLPWRLPKHFAISEERLYRRKGTLRDNSVDPPEISLGFSSRGKTDGKSNRLARFLKLNADEKAEYATNNFKLLPRVHYHMSKTTRNENSVRTSTTAVQSSQRVNKDYVFQDIVHTDRLNSYAVAPAPKEHKGTNWYITVVATVIILLFVVALCVYAPCGCLWKRHRSEFDVACPIKSSQKGMCSKCYLHSNAATKKMTYEERPHHVSVAMATNDSYHRQSSGNSAVQTSANTTQGSGKLKQAKSKVSSLFKGNQGGHLCEPVKYRYKPLKNPEKRESWTYEAEWTSVGAFLNKTPKLGSYGSTKDSEGRFVDRYGRRSRDSLDAGDEVVEYALKLRPRRRQVIELQEFPLGYSKSYLNIDLESDPGVVFDPYRDQLYRKKSRTSERLTFSDSDLRKLSCTDKSGTYDSEDLFNAARPRKSSLKMRTTRGKAKPKVVHFFPSNFNYDAQFVQIPPKNKMAEPEVGIFERSFNISYCESKKNSKVVDSEIDQEPSLKSTKASSDESIRLPENKRNGFAFSSSKEHAVDCDLPSPSMDITHDETFIPSRDCAGSFVNYGCRSSTEVLPDSNCKRGSQEAFRGEGKEKDAKNFNSLSSSVSDLCKNDLNYKPEPLAGLLSPIRRATHNRGKENKGIVTSQAAGDLVCVTSYVQPLSTSKYAVPYGNSIYQPQLDDTTKFKSSQSQLQSRFETDVWGMDKTSVYEPLQRFPEKETKKEN